MRCTGTYYVILIPLSVGVFPIFEMLQRYIFEKTDPTISARDLLHVSTGTNFNK
jgi:hypothetical protein